MTFAPQDPRLRGLVAYFYWHASDSPSFETSFTYYPNFKNAITVYLDADVQFSDSGSLVKPGAKGASKVLYSRNYDRAITVEISGVFKKFGIAFEPLGINAFLPGHLSVFAPLRVNEFGLFGPEFIKHIRAFAANLGLERITEIEAFMGSHFKGLEDHRIKRALDLLFQEQADISVAALAAALHINRKTLLRLFRAHLCTSVESYKKLIRFRNAQNAYISSTEKTRFTALALDHQYCDQPAFINHFKSITGLTPRTFFAKVQQYGELDTYWSPK